MPVSCALCGLVLCSEHVGANHDCKARLVKASSKLQQTIHYISCACCGADVRVSDAFECRTCCRTFCGVHRHSEDHSCRGSQAKPAREPPAQVVELRGRIANLSASPAASGTGGSQGAAAQATPATVYPGELTPSGSRGTVCVPKPASVGKHGKVLHGRSLVRALAVQATLAKSKALGQTAVSSAARFCVGYAFAMPKDSQAKYGWACLDRDWKIPRVVASCLKHAGQDPTQYGAWKPGVCIFAERCVSIVALHESDTIYEESLRCGFEEGCWFIFWPVEHVAPEIRFV